MKFIILGCGSSMGVPRPDGFFGNCDPNNKKNYRTRLLLRFKSQILMQKKIANLLNKLKISSKIKLTVDVDPVNFA